MALPPNAGNHGDGDIEDLLDDLNENTVNLSSIFEPAGEVEVIDVNEDDFASASSVKVARSKRRKTSTKLWKKLPSLIKTFLQSHWAILLTHINISSYTHVRNCDNYLLPTTYCQ